MSIHIWTDGACKQGYGGWGYVLKESDGTVHHTCGAMNAPTTNNRMELEAVIQALHRVYSPTDIKIHTDSKYVQQGIDGWAKRWRKNGWRTLGTNRQVINVDLWAELLDLMAPHKVKCFWVKGHNGNTYNELADQLAARALDEVLRSNS